MSTSLVKATETKIQIIDPLNFAKAESSLRMVCEGQLTVADLSSEYFADDETEQDLEGIAAQVPRLSANAQAGVFAEPGTPKADLKKCPDQIEGIILGRKQQKVLYRPKQKRADLARLVGYDLLAEDSERTKWICHNGDFSQPGNASLNPQLSPQERAEAKRLGIGGALTDPNGKPLGCLHCKAGQWMEVEGKNFRACNDVEALIFVSSTDPEPRVLQISAGNSVKAVKQFFAKRFIRNGKSLNLFTYVVRFGWTSQVIEGEEVLVLAPSVVGAMPPTLMATLKGGRGQCLWMLTQASVVPPELVDDSAERETVEGVEVADAADSLAGMI